MLFEVFKILTNPPAFSILSLADLEMKSVLIVNFSFNSPVPKTLSLTNLFLTIFLSFRYLILISSLLLIFLFFKKFSISLRLRMAINFFLFSLFKLLNPLFGFKVMSAILFESIKIILKGGKYYARNKKPKDTISYEGSF